MPFTPPSQLAVSGLCISLLYAIRISVLFILAGGGPRVQ